MADPISNYQSSLVLQQGIVAYGTYPTSQGTEGGFVGQILTYAFNFAAGGTYSTDGQVVPVNQFTPLFSRIGYNYADSNSSTFNPSTFHLPNLDGQTMVGTASGNGQSYGSATITLTNAQEPSSLGGSSAPIDNSQPSTDVSYYIRAEGQYPTFGGGSVSGSGNYIGEIVADAGSFHDEGGYLRADGRLLSIQEYLPLYSLLGTTYGGDGRTTFALPNLDGRTIIGAGRSADDHQIYQIGQDVGQSQINLQNGQVPQHGQDTASATFDNQQPSLVLNYAIATVGLYPNRSGGGTDPDTPVLGQVGTFAGQNIPDGWRAADGSVLPIRGNEALFSLLGPQYGGDGVSTFALPDLRGRSVIDLAPDTYVGQVVGANDQSVARSNLPPPCYVTGTLILTSRGEVPVEALAVGDLVVTASGAHRPIRWIGHRLTEIASHPEPLKVMPVRIEAGAVAPGVPVRDLRVSPDHAIALDGVLVKAGRLVNGAGITRENVASVTYWHVEFDSHDLLMAEGLAAESYIESDNRHAFENGGTVMAMHPDFEAAGDYASRTCLPLVEGGDRLKAIRAKLFARTPERFTADAQVMLLADGVALAPVSTDGRHHRFAVPEGVRSLRLVSRSGIASEVQGESGDHRRFGVMVRGLHIDGTAISFDVLGEGWNAQVPGRDHRWTDGDAVLPLGRAVSFVAAPLERYPADASVEARQAA